MADRKDSYYFRAKREQYRSRAAYKLLEIQKRFGILRGHENVLELGSSPGGWSQVISENTDGRVLSIDLNRQDDLPGVTFVRGDIFSDRTAGEIADFLSQNRIECFELVVSDTMGKTSGVSHRDHAISVELGERVMSLAGMFLCEGGNVVLKQFQGDMSREFVKKHGRDFAASKITTTKATRSGSSEIFILFTGLRLRKE